MSPSPSS
jgi:hypothetical protein